MIRILRVVRERLHKSYSAQTYDCRLWKRIQIAEKMRGQKRVKHMEQSILQIFMGPCNVFIYTVHVYIINGFEYLNTIQEMHRLGTQAWSATHTFNLIPARWHMPAAPTRVGHRCPLQAHQSWEESSTDFKSRHIESLQRQPPKKRKALHNWKSLEYHGISACES